MAKSKEQSQPTKEWCRECGRSHSEEEQRIKCQGQPRIARLLETREFTIADIRRALEADEQLYPDGLTIELDAGHNSISVSCPCPGHIVKERELAQLQAKLLLAEQDAARKIAALQRQLRETRDRPAHEFREPGI